MPPRLPAEWEPQAAVMLTWPHAGSDWEDDLPAVLEGFTALAVAIAQDQPVLSIVESQRHLQAIRTRLLAAGAFPQHLAFAIASSDDAWARDHGPLTVLIDDRPVLRDFDFNGWGGKFDHERDNAITTALSAQGVFADAEATVPGLVLEGGAIETDGQRTLLATRSSVITDSRNPGLGADVIEARLAETLGMDRFLWLDHGTLSGDDTDGHIDTLVRFADPKTLLHVTAPRGHPDHQALAAMIDELKALRQREGRPYRLIPLPCAGEHVDRSGRLLPATYANFVLTNRSVLMPAYGVAADETARDRLAQVFPQRRVVPIDCRAIIGQKGSLHCLTMQFPATIRLNASLFTETP